MNYGTLIDIQLHPAPRAIRIGASVVCNPTPAQYEAAGYLPVVDERPPCEEGYHAVAVGWETRDGAIHRVYEAVQDPPPPPRRWSRLAIETALAQAWILDAVDAYLAQVTVVGTLTAARAFSRCDYIEEGYPDATRWDALLDGAAQALGKTRAEIDAFLDAIPQEGGA